MDHPIVIYKYTNLFTSQIYVGSAINAHQRDKQHKAESPSGATRFYEEVKKWGWEAFSEMEILEVCKDSNRYHREDYWIKYYGTLDPHLGYNSHLNRESRDSNKKKGSTSVTSEERRIAREKQREDSARIRLSFEHKDELRKEVMQEFIRYTKPLLWAIRKIDTLDDRVAVEDRKALIDCINQVLADVGAPTIRTRTKPSIYKEHHIGIANCLAFVVLHSTDDECLYVHTPVISDHSDERSENNLNIMKEFIQYTSKAYKNDMVQMAKQIASRFDGKVFDREP